MSQKIENSTQLEEENAELKSQLKALSTLNSTGYPQKGSDPDEIDLWELWNAIWKGKWLIIAVTFVFSVGSVFFALSLPNEYKSTTILAPASQTAAGGMSKLAGQFGGLASLAGINFGGGGTEDKTVIAMEIIKTWGFLEKFILENNIQVEVFAATGWSRNRNELIIDPELYDVDSKTWVRDFDPSKGKTAEPSSWELYEKFKKRINISQDKATGLINLSVEYYSPNIAKEWSDKLVEAINVHIQEQDKEEAKRSIEYLNGKITETNIADMKAIFYQLIEEQTKTLMLAEVSVGYVFKTLSPAKISERKSKPKRGLIVLLGVLLGGLIAVTYQVTSFFSKKMKV